MTVEDLRKTLDDLDDSMEVGVRNRYGELSTFDGWPQLESVRHDNRGMIACYDPEDEPKPGERVCLLFVLPKGWEVL